MTYGKDIKFHIKIIDNKYLSLIKTFRCSNNEIDNYLTNKALKETKEGLGVTKLFLNESETNIIAYYTLTCSSMVIEQYSKNYFAPAVEIKMFAVNEQFQNLPFSNDKEDGVFSEFIFCKIIADINEFTRFCCGADRIILYSVKSAIDFYGDIGFENFENIMKRDNDRYLDGCTPMYLIL